MKKMIAALVVATAAAGITIARADDNDATGFRGHRHHRGMNKAQLLEKYDANHNGVLDPEEKEKAKADWQARRAEHEAKRLEKYDANHNGVLDPEEKDAAHKDRLAAREARRAEILKKYDTDGDGTLSETERAALRKDMREKHKTEGESR